MVKVKTFLFLTTLLLSAQGAFAIGNILAQDIHSLVKDGFQFKPHGGSSNREVVTFTVMAPNVYHFGETMGVKPFQGIGYLKTSHPLARRAELISIKGTKLWLKATCVKDAHTANLSVSLNDLKNSYLEIHYNQGSGYPPMLIHIPIQAIADYLSVSSGPKA